MPKKSSIDIKSIGKTLVSKTQEIVDNVPSATPDAPKEQGRGVPGRPKASTIQRKNAKTVYFDDEMFVQLDNVKYNNRVNMQRVIQTAVYDFFQLYYVDGKLTQKGMDRIMDYEDVVAVQ